MASEPEYDRNTLKASGLIQQKQADFFCVRLRIVGGSVGAEQLLTLARLCGKYGTGHVHLTTRQGVEIPNVRACDVERISDELEAAGLEIGVRGRRVRTITACQGGLCSHGVIDSQRLAQRIDAIWYGRGGLPHKFKIGITGCPNGCIKPRENDLGVMGLVLKEFADALCTGCGLCEQACPAPGALRIEDGQLLHDDSQCVSCGACVAACPTGAWQQVGVRYAIFVGGKMGKFPRLGDRLPVEVVDEEHLLRLVETVIEWYAEHGKAGERFGATLEAVGLPSLVDRLEPTG